MREKHQRIGDGYNLSSTHVRLLGAYRGIPEALIMAVECSTAIDWQHLNQPTALEDFAAGRLLAWQLTVLDDKRSLFNTELSYTQTQGALHIALIRPMQRRKLIMKPGRRNAMTALPTLELVLIVRAAREGIVS